MPGSPRRRRPTSQRSHAPPSARYNLPGGQTVTNAWNTPVNQSGSAVTARNVGHNGPIAPGGRASFG
ncbi:cellulose binding domain-containing protein [Micromonospora chokoriensis]